MQTGRRTCREAGGHTGRQEDMQAGRQTAGRQAEMQAGRRICRQEGGHAGRPAGSMGGGGKGAKVDRRTDRTAHSLDTYEYVSFKCSFAKKCVVSYSPKYISHYFLVENMQDRHFSRADLLSQLVGGGGEGVPLGRCTQAATTGTGKKIWCHLKHIIGRYN
jgi:hypothetical protein